MNLEKLLQDLRESYDKETNSFPAAVQEEYVTKEGWLDKSYICFQLRKRISTANFRKAVKEVFGCCVFEVVPVQTTATLQDVEDVYKFESETSVRQWIPVIKAKTGKIISREDLYQMFIDHKFSEQNDIFFHASGIRCANYKPSKLF